MDIVIDATQVAVAVAFLIGLLKWIDTRKRSIETSRYDQFNRAFASVAGRTLEGVVLVDVHQAMGVYELANFPEYRDISVPILKYYLSKTAGESDSSLFRGALLASHTKLTKA